MLVADVPVEFMCSARGEITHRGAMTLERCVHDYMFQHPEVESGTTYLPIHWMDYLCNMQWGPNVLDNLICFSKNLPSGPYWTLTQLDNGPYVDIPDCVRFGVGDARTDICIPLSSPSYGLPRNESPKILASFIGRESRLERRHLFDTLKNIDGFDVEIVPAFGEDVPVVDRMRNSIFALCPRGNIAQTFRLYEAMDLGCIPVYISDTFVTPFSDTLDWSEFCVLVEYKDIDSISDILKSISEDKIRSMQDRGKKVYDSHFSLLGLCAQITRLVGEL